MFFVFSLAWDKDMSHACDQNKNIFLYFFTKHKTYHLSYSNYVGFIVEKMHFLYQSFAPPSYQKLLDLPLLLID